MASHPPLPTPATSRPPHAPSPLSQPPSSIPQQNAGGPHLLSLKVMRASAPSLAISERPYYDDLDSGSSSAGLIASVGRGIQDGLAQDLLSNHWHGSSNTAASHFAISDLLVLPNSFGTLYLGETFRAYLCVRNESSTPVREPSLRVEMQVGSSDPQSSHPDSNVRWHQLAHIILTQPDRYSPDPDTSSDQSDSEPRPIWELASGSPLETSLVYDIKDLLPHVLVCTVGYKAPVIQEGTGKVVWAERSFRKFYKFGVERSPIGVRTKVHQPRHAASLYHPIESIRKRVELEVQVQNVAGNGASLVFNGLTLKPATGWKWTSVDRPSLTSGSNENDDDKDKSQDMWITTGSNELLADGDVRQYLFTLTPTGESTLSEESMKGGIDMGVAPQGHLIRDDALGHLDISWRMSMGEPGRLQTSQLVRRRVIVSPTSIPPFPTTTEAVSSSTSSGTGLSPQLKTELTLLPVAVEALTNIKAGEPVELAVNLAVCDLSGLVLPAKPLSQAKDGESGNSSGDDDDTPLSEISPKAARREIPNTITTSTDELIDITRTFRLALQHCTVQSPSPPVQPSLALDTNIAHESGPSTPRKSALPSRTSTPTTTTTTTTTTTQAASALAKSRLQANLSSLVRNNSLSLRPRGSVDSGRRDSIDKGGGGNPNGLSRVNTPQPPAVPPKTGLAPPLPINEFEHSDNGGDGKVKIEMKRYPEPILEWDRIVHLYHVHSETHAQALTRSTPSSHQQQQQQQQAMVEGIPFTFLPTPELVQFEGSSLIALPEVKVGIQALKGTDGKIYRSTYDSHAGTTTMGCQVSVETKLRFLVGQDLNDDGRCNVARVVRFGALRILLLNYDDSPTRSEVQQQEDEKVQPPQIIECMTILQEIPVFAESLLLPNC